MKKVLLILIYTLLKGSINAQQPTFQWAKGFGEANFGEQPNSIAKDSYGNIYYVGSFAGSVDFDPGSGTYTLAANNWDTFVAKLDQNGNFIWAKKLGGFGNDYGNSISIDNNNNVYTTGYFNGLGDFDPGAGVFNMIPVGYNDAYICKLDINGNFIWAKNIGGSSDDGGSCITTDNTGNVYVSGVFQSTVDFDPGAGVLNITSVGSDDIFLIKLNSLGNLTWVKTIGGTSNEYPNSIKVDASGNIYSTGYFKSSVDFDPGAGTTILNCISYTDIFVYKLDGLGNFIWAESFGSGGISDYNYGKAIEIDVYNNVIISGIYKGTVDFDPSPSIFNLSTSNTTGPGDVFTLKLNSLGNFIWGKSTDHLSGNGVTIYSLSLDTLGNIYSTGLVQGSVDFDPNASVQILNAFSATNTTVYISKLDVNGNLVWAKQLESINASQMDQGSSILVDNYNNVFVLGLFYSQVDFDFGPGVYNLSSTGTLYYDVFILKVSQGTSTNIEVKNSKDNFYSIYPNPSNSSIQISASEDLEKIELLSPTGNIIYSKTIDSKNSNLNVEELTNGIYFIKLYGNQVNVAKLLIHH